MENSIKNFLCFAHNIVTYECLVASQEGSAGLEGQARLSSRTVKTSTQILVLIKKESLEVLGKFK